MGKLTTCGTSHISVNRAEGEVHDLSRFLGLDSAAKEQQLSFCSTADLDRIQLECHYLQMEAVEQSGRRYKELMEHSAAAISDLEKSNRQERRTAAKVRKSVSKPLYKRLFGLITGSEKAKLLEAERDRTKERAKRIEAVHAIIDASTQEREVTEQLIELQASLLEIQLLVQAELQKERKLVYRVRKFLRVRFRAVPQAQPIGINEMLEPVAYLPEQKKQNRCLRKAL